MSERPTPAQWVGISELRRHLAVTAGAGAGKTWVLTERYLSMLMGRAQSLPPEHMDDRVPPSDFANPNDIVAITFTREAASEMRRRIRTRLRDCLTNDQNAPLRRQIERWMVEIETAPITTIHGYCGSLLRRFPLVAGIDPQTNVLEPYEASEMLRDAIRSLIDAGLTAFDETITGLAHLFGVHLLKRELERTYCTVREQTEHFEQIAHLTREAIVALALEAPTKATAFIEAVEQTLSFGQSDEGVAKGARERAMTFAQQWPTWRPLFEQMAMSGEYSDAIHDAATYLTNWGHCGKAMKPYVEVLKERFDAMQLCAYYSGDCELTETMCELLERVHVAYERDKQRRVALDFTDLQAKAVALLSDEAICRQVANGIRYLLVDEFQDTNHMQAELLRRLMTGNPAMKVFMVGDGKQSIYRFRGADVEVFTQAQNALLAQGGMAISLQHNFRTQAPIVQFINDLFARLMPAIAPADSNRLKYEAMEPTRKAEGQYKAVEIAHFEPTKSTLQSRMREARFIAGRIQELVAGDPCVADRATGLLRTAEYADVAMLFSAMTHVSTYERALQEAGVPYYVVGSRAFYRRQEVIDVLQALRVIVSPDDVLAHIAFLRSPLGGVSDDGLYWMGSGGSFTRWYGEELRSQLKEQDWESVILAHERLLRWRRESTWRTPAALIERIIEDTAYDHMMLLQQGGEQKVGNLRKLCQMAEKKSCDFGMTLVDFAHFLENMLLDEVDEEDAQVQAAGSNAVKIMTIHKSKGLEFPIVFVPQLDRRMAAATDAILYTAGRGMVVRRRDVAASDRIGLARELRERENEREREEFVRQFYVALTRARDMLILSGAKKEQREQQNYADKANWMDWLLGTVGDGTVAGLQSIESSFPMVRVTVLSGAAEETKDGQIDIDVLDTDADPDNDMDIRDEPHCSPDADEGRTSHWRTWATTTLAELAAVSDQGAAATRSQTPLLWDELGLQVPDGVFKQSNRSPLSVTSLLHLNRCKRLYYYEHVMQVPPVTVVRAHQRSAFQRSGSTASSAKKPKASQMAANVRGTVVHKAIEGLESSRCDSRAAIQAAFIACGIDGTDTDDAMNELLPHLERYRVSALAKELEDANIIRELPFQAQFDAFVLSGIIDCLAILHNGQAMIVDYKTNEIDDDVQLERAVEQYAPQLKLYAKVVRDVLGLPVSRAVLYFTSLGRTVDVPHGVDDIEPLLAEVTLQFRQLSRSVNSADYARTDSLERCAACQHRVLCGR